MDPLSGRYLARGKASSRLDHHRVLNHHQRRGREVHGPAITVTGVTIEIIGVFLIIGAC